MAAEAHTNGHDRLRFSKMWAVGTRPFPENVHHLCNTSEKAKTVADKLSAVNPGQKYQVFQVMIHFQRKY